MPYFVCCSSTTALSILCYLEQAEMISISFLFSRALKVFFLQTFQKFHLWLKSRKRLFCCWQSSAVSAVLPISKAEESWGNHYDMGDRIGSLKKVRVLFKNIWEKSFCFLWETGWDVLASWGSSGICLRNIFKTIFRWNEENFCKLITLETWRAIQFKSYKPE